MGDSDDDESFHDAVEYISVPTTPTKILNGIPMDLSTSIDDAKIALELFMNNHFEEARQLLKPWAKESMYHALGHGVFQFLEAALTFEQEQIESAAGTLEESVEVCNKFRKKSSMVESLGKMVRKPNYDTLSEEEMHAELCYAECLLLRAILTFVEDENLISFVRGGLKIRSCLNSYKECSSILKHRKWKDSESGKNKINFECGVRMGMGSYNLLISMLPARIMKLLEFIGFSGNRENGLGQLYSGAFELEGSLRQVLCSMVLLAFNLFVCYVLGAGEGDLILCDQIINQQLAKFPDGVWYNFFKGRCEYVKGEIEGAIDWYMKAWQSQSEWVQFHHMCYWELMWAHCFKQDWRSARDFADLLLHDSRWSKTIYGYQKASFMCMYADILTKEEAEQLDTLFKNIPTWKQRIAGKSIPMEKFAVRKCERYFAQGGRLVLPAFELLYMWNGFKILGKKADYIRPFLRIIDGNLVRIQQYSSKEEDYFVDNLCLLYLLRGTCLKYLGDHSGSEDSFRAILAHEKELQMDNYLPPAATFELGCLQQSAGNYQTAITTLENAKNNYKGYALESRLHIRIHTALADIRKPNSNSNSNSRAHSSQPDLLKK